MVLLPHMNALRNGVATDSSFHIILDRQIHKDVIHDLCTNPTTRALYPNISKLAQICRVIPVHTAGVERTFSQLKLKHSNSEQKE